MISRLAGFIIEECNAFEFMYQHNRCNRLNKGSFKEISFQLLTIIEILRSNKNA
jgi:hypothetical protein